MKYVGRWEDVCRYYAILSKRLEHPWILLTLMVLEPFTPIYSVMTTSEAARDSRGDPGRGVKRFSFWTQKLYCVEWNGLTLLTAVTLLSLGFSSSKSWYKNCSSEKSVNYTVIKDSNDSQLLNTHVHIYRKPPWILFGKLKQISLVLKIAFPFLLLNILKRKCFSCKMQKERKKKVKLTS